MNDFAETRPINLNSKARAKLVAAARTVMARDGIDTSSIPEIVAEAGVGRGSFYNHFRSKEDLARVVFVEQTAEMRTEFDILTQNSTDVPRVMAYTLKRCFDMTIKDPLWGRFIVHAEQALDDFEHIMGDSATFGISRGRDLGLMAIDDLALTLIILQASVTGTIKALINGTLPADQIDNALVLLLRIVGVEESMAQQISHEPMDELLRKITPAV